MEWNLYTIINLLISGSYVILLILFSYQISKRKRSAPYLLSLLCFGLVGAFFAFLDSSALFPTFTSYSRIYLIFELTCYGLQFFFFYLFVESISHVRPRLWGIVIMCGLVILQNSSLYFMIWFSSISEKVIELLWLPADIGYNGLALMAFGIFGIPTYYRLYRYTKERKALGFIFSLILVISGFIIYSFIDYLGFFDLLPSWLENISILGEIFPLSGLFLFLITYGIDVDYIYRLPADHYTLMVSYKESGILLHSVNFKTHKNVDLKEHLFSGFISSFSLLFSEIFKEPSNIETISGKNIHSLMRSGKYINVMMVTRQPTLILERAMDRYIKEFENKYENELKQEIAEVSKFDNAISLVTPIFPFLKIKKE